MKNKILEKLLYDLGLSQITLANFIGVEDIIIAHYLEERKELPYEAAQKVALINSILETLQEIPAAEPTEKHKKLLLEKAAKYKAKCIPMQKKLARMKQSYRQACLMELLLDAMGHATESDPPNKQRWLNNQRYEAIKKQDENDWYNQYNLEMIINRFKQQAEFWEAAVK